MFQTRGTASTKVQEMEIHRLRKKASFPGETQSTSLVQDRASPSRALQAFLWISIFILRNREVALLFL